MTFDPNNREEDPTLYEALLRAIEQRACEIHTSMPAEIVSYDAGTNLAVVKPSLRRKYVEEAESVDLPNITSVPVSFPRTKKAHIYFPLAAGDEGQIIFCERSIDKWTFQGGTVDPDDPRKHSLADAVFYPGLHSQANPLTIDSDDTSVEIKNNNTLIELTEDGKVRVKNAEVELIDLHVKFIEAIIRARVNTVFGPQPIIELETSNFATILADFNKLKKG